MCGNYKPELIIVSSMLLFFCKTCKRVVPKALVHGDVLLLRPLSEPLQLCHCTSLHSAGRLLPLWILPGPIRAPALMPCSCFQIRPSILILSLLNVSSLRTRQTCCFFGNCLHSLAACKNFCLFFGLILKVVYGSFFFVFLVKLNLFL